MVNIVAVATTTTATTSSSQGTRRICCEIFEQRRSDALSGGQIHKLDERMRQIDLMRQERWDDIYASIMNSRFIYPKLVIQVLCNSNAM